MEGPSGEPKETISLQEGEFVTRLAANILVVRSNLLHVQEISKPYPGRALDEIGAADGGRVMKLSGIAYEVAGTFQKTLEVATMLNHDDVPAARSEVIVTQAGTFHTSVPNACSYRHGVDALSSPRLCADP